MRILLTLFLAILLNTARAAYPSASSFGATGEIHGFSQTRDHLTAHHHTAYVDVAEGKVIYKLLQTDGTVLDTKEVGATQQTVAGYNATSVDFDSNSRPVVAYTKLDGGVTSIQVARWNGSAWITAQAASGFLSNRLSLALRNRDAATWRLAYVHFTAPSLRLVSAGGSDVKLADLEPSPWDAGIVLSYSANSGSVAFQSPAEGLLKFGNPPDDGTNASAPLSYHIIDDAGRHLAGLAGPGGWPHFAYVDGSGGALKLARRLPDFSWTHEEAIRPTFGTLSNPALWFDPQGNPVVACTDSAGDRLRFAARIAGRWLEDSIDLVDLMRRPVFFTADGGGGFRLFAVTDWAHVAASHVRGHGPIDDFLDADGDGVPLRFERAFMMNSTLRDRDKLPLQGIATIGGQKRLTLTVRHPAGGTVSGASYTANGLIMRVETSTDLLNWVSSTEQIGSTDVFTVSGVRYATYHAMSPVGTTPRFLRVRVERQ